MNNTIYTRYIKRIFDIIIILLLLPMVIPIFIILIFLIRICQGEQILFQQKRPGRYGRPFTMYKFRTMTDKRDMNGNLLDDTSRMTSIGKFLRKTSLDELPELFNVVKGDMSLVGPRPLLMEYLPYYTEREKCRHHIRPGITGLSQVSGRNLLGWDERLEMDVCYVENCSLFIDLKILVKTIVNVIVAKNVVTAPGTIFGKLSVERKKRSVDIE